MRAKAIFLSAVVLFCAVSVIQAQGDIHGSVGVTYDSKYIWRGFDVYGDKSAIHPFVDLDLGQGFGISAMGHRANSSGHENAERWDYTLYYQNQLFPDETYVINYRLGWVYYNYPDQPEKGSMTAPNAALQEMHTILSWPKICPAGVVPSYVLVKLWPSKSGSFSGSRSPMCGTASGYAHIFMLDYGLSVECPMTGEEKVLNLHSEFVYNDGVGPAGQNVDQDWSNAVFGVSTNYDLGNDLTLTPGLYHQVTMDDSVNDDKDETWISMTLRYAF
ncbi:hypothetical protein ACFL1G_08880 [Planctomycetota bacterium]